MDYQKTAAEYAKLYGRSERQIKRYKADNWPLDDEQATRLLLAGGTQGGAQGNSNAAPRPKGTGAKGLAAAIERMQEAERDAHAAYLAAIDEENELLASKRLKDWQAIVEQLRKTEQSNPEVEAANKNSVNLAELRGALTDLFARLRQDLDALPRRVATELAGADELTVRAVLERETGELVANLYGCKYLTEGGGNES